MLLLRWIKFVVVANCTCFFLPNGFALVDNVDVNSSEAKFETDLKTVKYVDVNRYLGKWYQIASIPQKFEVGCKNVTATYSKLTNTAISVKNFCQLEEKKYVVNGSARVVDLKTNAKLKVKLMSPVERDYWVIELDTYYSYAIVGTPDREGLWILSRSPEMEETLYQNLLRLIKSKHKFNLDKIKRSIQDVGEQAEDVVSEAVLIDR